MWAQTCDFIHCCAEEMEFTNNANGTKRKLLYRQYVLHTEGRLGQGVCVNPPKCVKRDIWALFPEAHSSYIGFKEKIVPIYEI